MAGRYHAHLEMEAFDNGREVVLKRRSGGLDGDHYVGTHAPDCEKAWPWPGGTRGLPRPSASTPMSQGSTPRLRRAPALRHERKVVCDRRDRLDSL